MFLVISYVKVKILEVEIEKKHREYENYRSDWRSRKGVTMQVINTKVDWKKERIDEEIAPLSRKRERILSKIPFIK
jgi:hypothetical protein